TRRRWCRRKFVPPNRTCMFVAKCPKASWDFSSGQTAGAMFHFDANVAQPVLSIFLYCRKSQKEYWWPISLPFSDQLIWCSVRLTDKIEGKPYKCLSYAILFYNLWFSYYCQRYSP